MGGQHLTASVRGQLLTASVRGQHLTADEVAGGLVAAVRTDEVGEEEELQHGEDEDELHHDDDPQLPAPRHLAEAVDIKSDKSMTSCP